MDFVSDHDFPNLDIVSHGLTSSCVCSVHHLNVVDTHNNIMEISPLEGFSELDWPYSSNQLCFNELPDLENLDLDFSLPDLEDLEEEYDQKPLNIVFPLQGFHCNNNQGLGDDALLAIQHVSATCAVKKEEVQINNNTIDQSSFPVSVSLASSSITQKRSSSSSSCVLEFEDIKKHFNVPISEAAKQMNVGITMLKKRCRELNIMRWPHRKLKSLQLLIDNFKEIGLEDEVQRLEKHKRLLEKLPGMELSKEVKKLRQACFKANYKKRKCMALLQA